MKRWLAFLGILSLTACSGLGQDGPSQEEMSDALARRGEKVQSTERIACKAAPSLPGYICDFKTTVVLRLQQEMRQIVATHRPLRPGDGQLDVHGRRRTIPAAARCRRPNRCRPRRRGGDRPRRHRHQHRRTGPVANAEPDARRRRPKPSPSATPSPKPTADAQPPKPTPAGVNRTWLSGRWGAGAGDCTARRAVKFGGGGGFYGKRGIGRWSLKGKTVTVTGTYSDSDKPFEQKLGVERTGDDAMTMEGKRYHRCPN